MGDGYEKDSNDECIDKNECDDNPCTDIETCDNTVGSYTCSCNKGYEANTDENTNAENPCVDIDECANDPCTKAGQECSNTVGSYECECKSSCYINLDEATKGDTPCLRCDITSEIEFNEECIKCSGPTASLNDAGECTCANVRGMILNNGVCECNEAKNFELDADTETCKCTADTNESVDGICRKADDGVRWGDPEWGSCTDGKRQRPLKAFDCKKNENADGVNIAFWSCDVTRARVFEDCGEDATDVICTDYNAEFDAADGVCKCKSGFFDTPEYGCLLFEKETVKTERKSKSNCGKKSRGANPLFYKNIKELYEAFKTEADKPDTDGAALANLIELYSVWVKQSLFNCYNMGYGSDPQDGHTDADGVTCEKSNQKETTKCRFEFKQANYYNRFAEQKISFN